MRYFYDCEFIENGITIDLVSVGVVAEDGREFYAVSTEFDAGAAGPWVRRNVLPKLPSPSSEVWKSRSRIRDELYDFVTAPPTGEVEMWAWIGAYDRGGVPAVGGHDRLLAAMPRFTRDVRQAVGDAAQAGPAHPPAGARRARRCPARDARFRAIAASPHLGL